MEVDLELLRTWIGKQEIVEDVVTPVPMAALSATLDRDDPRPREGDELPALWHWLYCLPLVRQSQLEADGHPARGGFLPPVPLARRMWAGGRFTFTRPLHVGEAITRTSRITDVSLKDGRAGRLVFVVVRHEVAGAEGPALSEEHDIVYREAPLSDAAAPAPRAAPADPAWRRDIVPDEVLLFRYSALTFNGHRIHYDRRYVTETQSYPGLVVHGPLLATLLLDLLRRNCPAPVSSFRFRAVQPLFDTAGFAVCGAPGEGGEVALWAQDEAGHVAMEAQATCEAMEGQAVGDGDRQANPPAG